jgi:hypothetical protein
MMINWQLVWNRLSNRQHVVLCGTGAVPEPDMQQVRLSWVDCEAHPEPGGTIEAARRCIDHDLNVNPWLDEAAQRLRSGLRRHLLGEDAEDIDSARAEHVFRHPVLGASVPCAALLLSGVDRADTASIERLRLLFASERPPTWPLLIRFDAREPTGAARALLEQLERVLPPEAIFKGIEAVHPGRSGTSVAEALGQLSPESLRVLRAAATIGDRFEIATLAELLEVDEIAVLDAIQEGLDRGLSLEDRGHGIFRFDAGTGSDLRSSTLPALSTAWHRRLAELFGGLPSPVPANVREGSPIAPTDHDGAAPEGTAPDNDGARAALHAEAAGLPESAARGHLSAALRALRDGRHEVALEAAGRAISAAESATEPARGQLEARALLVIGQCRWLANGPERASLELALEPLERARERAATARLPDLQAEIASVLANVCYDIGTPQALERALVEVTRASQLWHEAARPFEAARLLNDEAAIWVRRGNFMRAKELLARSRAIFGELSPTHPTARLELLETEHLLARLALHSAAASGRDDEALQVAIGHALGAEAGYRALGMLRQLGRVWETLGRLHLRLERVEDAGQWLERAYRLQREIGDTLGSARSAGGLSEVFVSLRDYPRALHSLAESAAFNSEKGAAAGLQHNLASLRQLEGHLPESLAAQARGLGLRIVRDLSAS